MKLRTLALATVGLALALPTFAADAKSPMKPGKWQITMRCDYKLYGNTVTWTVSCTGKQKMTGEGKMTFSGDAYEGTTHMEMDGGMEMTQHFSGKYLGECDK